MLHRFKPGESGNPGGRAKGYHDAKELCRRETQRNIRCFIRLRDKSKDESIKLRAATVLHEIAWGKPSQEITGANGGPLAITFTQMLQKIDGSGNKQEKL